MEVIIDKRIELMAVIQALDSFWDDLWLKLFNKKLYQCQYKENVFNYFEKYKNHKTIKLWNELCHNIQDVSFWIKLPLCYSNPPNMDNIAGIENNLKILSNIKFPYKKLISGIKQFYKDTDFEYFFENNKNEYKKIISDYANKKEVLKYVNIIEDYFGNKINNYTIIISALLADCYEAKIITNENTVQNYSVMCVYDYKDNKYIFGKEYSVKELIWHEMSHLTINDLTKCYLDRFNISKKIISNDLVKNYYTNVEIIVNEYIIRAITIRLFEIYKEEKYVEYLIQDYAQRGFKEIESVKNYISKYCEENSRILKNDKYLELIEYVINKI